FLPFSQFVCTLKSCIIIESPLNLFYYINERKFLYESNVKNIYSILLMGAGVLHFINLEGFRRIVPSVLPCKTFIVKFTGVLEILFSVLLWVKSKNNLYGKLIALFMIAV